MLEKICVFDIWVSEIVTSDRFISVFKLANMVFTSLSFFLNTIPFLSVSSLPGTPYAPTVDLAGGNYAPMLSPSASCLGWAWANIRLCMNFAP